ncbi:MAG: hypothetical protein V4587_05320 [Acidobacteriota bacterium]
MTSESGMPMKIDAEIDAALEMLAEAQPPAQLVPRVHHSLKVAATAQTTRSRRRFSISAVGAAMATVALVAIITRMHSMPKNQEPVEQTTRLVANTPMAQATMPRSSVPAEIARTDEGKRLVRYYSKTRSRASRENRHAVNLLSYPLTRQEKLLLQFAHNAKPADLQALDPEYQAKVEAQQEAEFAAYLKSGDGSSTQETAN